MCGHGGDLPYWIKDDHQYRQNETIFSEGESNQVNFVEINFTAVAMTQV